MKRYFLWSGLGLALSAGMVVNGAAEDWPGWRGPNGNGVSSETQLPQSWSKSENVVWRVPLPGPGNASPIVWGDRVFVAQAVAADKRRTLMCFERSTGKLLWQSGIAFSGEEPTHQTNPYCAGTPATDGKLVYVAFGTPGVYAYDFEGKQVWHADLGDLTHMFGSAVSPVLVGDLCIVNHGPTENARLVALDKATGEIRWEKKPPAVDPSELGPPRGAGGPGGRGGFGPGMMIAPAMISQGDKNDDTQLSAAELVALGEQWFDKMDPDKIGSLNQEQFGTGLEKVLPPPPGAGGGRPGRGGPGGQGGPGGFGGGPGRTLGPGLFAALDADKDGQLKREEMTSTLKKWAGEWGAKSNGLVDEVQLRDGLTAALPAPNFGGGRGPGGPGGPGGGPGGPGGPGGAGPGGPGAGGPGGPSGRGSGRGGGGGGSWSTPVVIDVGGHQELIVNFPGRVVAYDPQTGDELWVSKGVGGTIYTTPVWGEGLLIASSSGMGVRNAVALVPGGRGDVTENKRLWQQEGIQSQMGSGVIHEGHHYSISQEGVATCIELKTGKEVWQKRLRGAAAQGGVWSSMLLANGLIYVPNQAGDVFVLRASPEYELVATNSLEESTNASLAASEGQLFMRTDEALYCLGNAK